MLNSKYILFGLSLLAIICFVNAELVLDTVNLEDRSPSYSIGVGTTWTASGTSETECNVSFMYYIDNILINSENITGDCTSGGSVEGFPVQNISKLGRRLDVYVTITDGNTTSETLNDFGFYYLYLEDNDNLVMPKSEYRFLQNDTYLEEEEATVFDGHAIQIVGQNITLDCNDSYLIGSEDSISMWVELKGSNGILIDNSNDIIIKNCRMSNFTRPIDVYRSNNTYISDIWLGGDAIMWYNGTFFESEPLASGNISLSNVATFINDDCINITINNMTCLNVLNNCIYIGASTIINLNNITGYNCGTSCISSNGASYITVDNLNYDNDGIMFPALNYGDGYQGGVYFRNGDYNIVKNSIILNGQSFSIQLRISQYNQIFNNIFNSSYILSDIYTPSSTLTEGILFRDKVFGENTFNNSVYGNKYYENGSGYSEVCINADNDSICDYPLYFNNTGDTRNVDYKPFALNEIPEPEVTTTTTTTTTTSTTTTTEEITTTTEEITTTTATTTSTTTTTILSNYSLIIFGFNATQLIESLPNVSIIISTIIIFLNYVIWAFLGSVIGLLVFAMLLKFIGIPIKFADSIVDMISGLLRKL